MITTYPVKLSVVLKPIYHADVPRVAIGINDQRQELDLDQTTRFDLNFSASAGKCYLNIEFLNKTDQDTVIEKNLDKAVSIEEISFFGISDPRFVWQGVYTPIYPEPWATQQREQGIVLETQLQNQTYLAWNGQWTLTFVLPVFTWIHELQDLGWIYS